jgi:hypothetical protein
MSRAAAPSAIGEGSRSVSCRAYDLDLEEEPILLREGLPTGDDLLL